MNPCYVDAGYVSPVRGPAFGAHPCWLSSVHNGVEYIGPAGTYPVIGSVNWHFERPVVLGERIGVTTWLVGQAEKTTELAGKVLVHDLQVDYLDESGGLVASAVTTLFHIDPAQARGIGQFAGWTRSRYTDEQFEDIEHCYDNEQIRGAAVRYLDEVRIGEVLPPIVRGPLTSEEIVLFVGATRPVASGEVFSELYEKGAVSGFVHPESGLLESTAASLLDDASAVHLGFPAAHDMGPDRVAQCATLVTNWMGDLASLRELRVRLELPHMLGDTAWFDGAVVGLPHSGDRTGIVAIDITVSNQRSETIATGRAVVELPRRRLSPAGRGARL
jgi:acyl dehydratase